MGGRGVRAALALATGLLLVAKCPRDDPAECAILVAVAVFLVAGVSTDGRERSGWFAVAALAVLGGWVVHPACFVLAAAVLGLAWLARLSTREPSEPRDRLAILTTGVAVLAPSVLTIALLALGGPGAALMRSQLASALPARAAGAAALVADAAALWVCFRLAARDAGDGGLARSGARAVPFLVACGVLYLVVARARWMASVMLVPTEMQWSEAPHLLNLLKLELGRPLYGPLSDCNSYPYSPLLELVHRTILSPFGRSLSLGANRCLNLLWQGTSVAVLVWSIGGIRQSPSLLGTAGLALGFALVVTSSFLAPNIHPDHLAMLAFSLAIALVISEQRMPRWLFSAGLLLVPAFGTMAKLTGAGIGVGLVLSFAWPMRVRELVILGVGGLVALGTIPLFDATLGPFSTYAIHLMASHRILWSNWPRALWGPEGRSLIAAALALGAVWAGTKRRPGAEVTLDTSAALRDGVRLFVLTVGFVLPSMLAYLKVGGRVNNLLPMTIGGAAILALLGGTRATAFRSLVLGPAALSLLSGVAPPEAPVARAERERAADRFDTTVRLLRAELASARSTLYYDGTAAWIAAGGQGVPLDRWQTIEEFLLGGHPEVEIFHDRLRSGHYQSVILGSHVLSPRYSPDADTLREILARHFHLAGPEPGPEDEGRPLVYRYTH